MIMPPTCWVTWRGKCASCSASSIRCVHGGASTRSAYSGSSASSSPEPLDAVAVAQLGDLVEIGQRDAERLADVAHRAAQLVGREGADQRRAARARSARRPARSARSRISRGKSRSISGTECSSSFRKRPKKQVVLDRIDVREPDQVADDRADRRAPSPPRRQIAELAGRDHRRAPRRATSRASSSRSR